VRTANGASTAAAVSTSAELTGKGENDPVIPDLYRVPGRTSKFLQAVVVIGDVDTASREENAAKQRINAADSKIHIRLRRAR
jgi:hypothetical protein